MTPPKPLAFWPIENTLQADGGPWSLDYIRVMGEIRAQRGQCDLVSFHKGKLGTQTRTLNGEFRYWIWQMPTWTVAVSNHKGVIFEVPESATIEEALVAWGNYEQMVLRPVTQEAPVPRKVNRSFARPNVRNP